LKNCKVVQLGAGFHYLQEDHAEAIGSAVLDWLSELRAAHATVRVKGEAAG